MLDVRDVPKGKDCGCICPSCKTPLIAVKGAERIWHFRHNSRSGNQTEHECRYSFYVSLRLMAKELIGGRLEFTTPHHFIHGKSVTESKLIIIEQIVQDAKFEKSTVDVLGKMVDRDLVIYFTHPGRQLPYELRSPEDKRCGIVEIQMNDWGSHFFHTGSEPNTSHTETLLGLLSDDISCKRWVYHPRQEEIQKRLAEEMAETERTRKSHFERLARERQEIQNSQQNLKNQTTRPPCIDDEIKQRRCLVCNHNWKSLIPKCPKCGEILRIASD